MFETAVRLLLSFSSEWPRRHRRRLVAWVVDEAL